MALLLEGYAEDDGGGSPGGAAFELEGGGQVDRAVASVQRNWASLRERARACRREEERVTGGAVQRDAKGERRGDWSVIWRSRSR